MIKKFESFINDNREIEEIKYTIEQLEEIALDSRNYCYSKSTAFQLALEFIKEQDEKYYKYLLLREIEEMERTDELEELYDEEL